MKSLYKLSFLFLLLTISNYSLAYGYLTKLSESGVTIKKYFVHNEGGVSLLLNEKVPYNPDGCAVTNHVYIKGDKEGHKAMISAALAAFAAGKQIGLHSYGCEIIPFWGGTSTRPTVSELWVIQ
jgi:hypothetical protein